MLGGGHGVIVAIGWPSIQTPTLMGGWVSWTHSHTHRRWDALDSSMCQLLGSQKQTNCSLWSTPCPLPARLGWWRADGKG